MTDRPTATGPAAAAYPERILTQRPDGGLRLQCAAGESFELCRDAGRLRVDEPSRCSGWTIQPDRDAPGLVLLDGDDGNELARTSRGPGADAGAIAPSLLTADGRLFRIRSRVRPPRFELCGWETPGAYLVIEPTEEGWRVRPTTASAGLAEIDTLTLLVAAEVLAAEPAAGHPGEPT